MPRLRCSLRKRNERLHDLFVAMVRGNASDRALERQFSDLETSDSAIHRCGTECFGIGRESTKTPATTPDALDLSAVRIDTAADVLDVAQRVLGRLDRLASKAERDGDIRGAVAAISALNKSLTDLFARVHGLVSDQPIIDNRQITIEAKLAELSVAELRALAYGKTLAIEGEVVE